MKMIDLFSGIGGFHLGLLRAGVKVDYCGYSEIDKYAKQIYGKHFPESEDLGDVRRIKPNELIQRIGNIDCICGGFPCQAFSIAGKRRGFEDTRGTLFFEICRLARELKPKILFLENVRGLLSHEEGCTFETIIRELGNIGYFVEWQVLNSKNFGVPQNRERVFIVGHLGGFSGRQVFPIRKEVSRTYERTKQTTVNTLTAGGHSGGLHSSMTLIVEKMIGKVKIRKYPVDIKKLVFTLRKHKKPVKEISEKLKIEKTTVEHWFRKDKCFSIPDALIWFKLKEFLNIETNEFDKSITEFELRDNEFDMSNRVYQKEGIAPTLTTLTGGHQHSLINDGYSIRRLSIKECERLQGYPDNYTKGISDTQRHKCLGNSVTVNVIKEIAKKILTNNK